MSDATRPDDGPDSGVRSNSADVGDPRRWWILLATTGSLAMILLDTTVVGVALPTIRGDLLLTDVGEQWIVNAYVLAIASTVAIGGRMGDLFGRVPLFVLGVIGFAAASAWCGLATTGPMLIVGRVLQGLAAACMQPASATLVLNAFPSTQRGRVMALYVGIPMLFLTLGPVIGGILTEQLSWRWCFWINLPIAITALTLILAVRPREPERPPPVIDWLGLLLLLVGLPSLIAGLQLGPRWGWADVRTIGAIGSGLLLLAAFVRVEATRAHPLIHLELLRDRGFLASALVLCTLQFAMVGLVIQISIHLQTVLGFDAQQAGVRTLPLMLPVLILVHVAGRAYDRIGPRAPVLLGTGLAVIGLVIQAVGSTGGAYWPLAIGMVILGCGIAFAMGPANTDGLNRVPPAKRGQASGVLQTFRQFGATFGLAVIGAATLATQQRLATDVLRDFEIAGVRPDDRPGLVAFANEHPEVADPILEVVGKSIAAGFWIAAVAAGLAFLAAFAWMHRGRAVSGESRVATPSSGRA